MTLNKCFIDMRQNICMEIVMILTEDTDDIIIEPRHEISNDVVCETSKGSDQSAHMLSLIRAFASHLNIV